MAFSTSSFRIRNEIVRCENLEPANSALCALDIGYSAVKGFSPHNRFCFPSYVSTSNTELIGPAQPTDIRYQDEDGTIFAVGSLAQQSLDSRDTNNASNTMFGRNRYMSREFKILARVGIALALPKGETRPICLQTGLPPAYRKGDTALLKDALAGRHTFSLRVGNGPWVDFDFTLDESRIFVTDQPIGSVYSASKRNDGSTILLPDRTSYIDHRLLVLDGGFGTLDIYSVVNRAITSSNTFNDLGMKAIFEGVSSDIFSAFGTEIYAHTLANCLPSGEITVFDRRKRATHKENICELLLRNTRIVCERAMEKVEAAYDGLQDYDFLLVTGGTGAAWLDMLRERYKQMETLQVIAANANEQIPAVYSNVRGYYILRALAERAGEKKG